MARCAEVLAWIASVFFAVSTVLRSAAVPVLNDHWPSASRDADPLDSAGGLEGAGAEIFSYGWIAFLITVVLLMVVWFQVLDHARMQGADMELSAGWAIGSWFVPVGNLVLTALVAANVMRLAGWHGRLPMGRQWRTPFPIIALVPPSAFVCSLALNGVAGSIERDPFGPDVAQLYVALATAAWVVALVATALIVRRTRKQLAMGPLVASPSR